jgi:outer membrane autotransporter protein
MLYGNQINLVAGLTRRLAPNFLVGVLGGFETFDYRSDALLGRLKGDGWTVGSYLGWKPAGTIRFDAAVAYSGIGYDGSAGTASGTFRGNRWMVSGGLTGSYQGLGLLFEPSARVYALWERENAYTDSLGTLQTARDFSTGRASAGLKVAYPIAWSSTIALAPYVGMYGDYYFSSDNAIAALAASGLPGAVVLDGFSARAIGGVTGKFANGGTIALGAEFSGIGGDASIWTYRARASVPF